MKRDFQFNEPSSFLSEFKRDELELRGEIDYYGASAIIARLNGISRVNVGTLHWIHGWRGHMPLHYPEQLLTGGRCSKDTKILVHTPQQELFLKDHGYHHAKAVGMPFCYALRLSHLYPRKEGSLLVLPPHISRYSASFYNESDYVKSIQQISSSFERVVICISGECNKSGRWRTAFEESGFQVISGALITDSNSLTRMVSLFCQFDVVTSPNIGSHLVYAGLCECRISVWGNSQIPQREAMEKEPYYQKNPHILDLFFSEETRRWRLDLLKRFQCEPQDATCHRDWACIESGHSSMLENKALLSLIEGSVVEQLTITVLQLLRKFANGVRIHGRSLYNIKFYSPSLIASLSNRAIKRRPAGKCTSNKRC